MPSITVKDVDLHYELSGPEGAPVVAFSNSIGTTLEMWDAQAEALSGHYRCLRYDTRGHGRSTTVDRSITINDLADDLAGLLDALGMPKAHIVGLSLGGMTAQAFTLRYPERTTSLTLMATAAYLPPAEAWEQRKPATKAPTRAPSRAQIPDGGQREDLPMGETSARPDQAAAAV